ncbi:fimbrial protein [Serratia quinivorans]|uniref:fimbrial protein n=1 Tax=Serratia quinivorans TaxID=137545 RepID=UPI002178EF73|nr:fimbrial protein [Serratia quinivorans]CAI1094783.1 S-fimbrial protein subunit SfaG precursor [Serratia quinivorans]CAI2069147.1 S-fimbrial protein subunit SfaG precursor [Serratia quinivorans]
MNTTRILVVLAGLVSTPLWAADDNWQVPNNWQVEGANGTLNVSGVLSEGACRLAMDSADQTVTLGVTPLAELAKLGARSAATAVTLRLRDCLRGSGASRDERSGNLSWGRQQPVMTMSFLAPADADNPQLVKVQGVSGIGLRLLDGRQQDVRLGSRGIPQFVSPGDEVLVWYVAAERTRAPLQAGAYRATVNFRLSYE